MPIRCGSSSSGPVMNSWAGVATASGSQFPDLNVRIESIVADEDMVAVWVR